MRLPAVSSSASNWATVVARGTCRICPFTAIEIAAMFISSKLNEKRREQPRGCVEERRCMEIALSTADARFWRAAVCMSFGAGDGDRTHVLSLGSSGPAIERHPHQNRNLHHGYGL